MLPNNDDELDVMLRNSEHYIEDNGFTGRVLAALPSRRHDFRPWVLMAAAMLGCLVAFVLFPGGELIIRVVDNLVNYRIGDSPPFLPLAVLALVASYAVMFMRGQET